VMSCRPAVAPVHRRPPSARRPRRARTTSRGDRTGMTTNGLLAFSSMAIGIVLLFAAVLGGQLARGFHCGSPSRAYQEAGGPPEQRE
jgi:hypothetical protein